MSSDRVTGRVQPPGPHLLATHVVLVPRVVLQPQVHGVEGAQLRHDPVRQLPYVRGRRQVPGNVLDQRDRQPEQPAGCAGRGTDTRCVLLHRWTVKLRSGLLAAQQS